MGICFNLDIETTRPVRDNPSPKRDKKNTIRDAFEMILVSFEESPEPGFSVNLYNIY